MLGVLLMVVCLWKAAVPDSRARELDLETRLSTEHNPKGTDAGEPASPHAPASPSVSKPGTNQSSAAPTATVMSIVEGDDWHLPAGVTASARSGIYGLGRLNGLVTDQVPLYTWSGLAEGGPLDSPTLNRATLSKLFQALKARRVIIRLKNNAQSEIPGYVINRNHWVSYNNGGLVVYPLWQKGWLVEYKAFLNAFLNVTVTGTPYKLKDHPNLVGLQIQMSGTGKGEPYYSKANMAKEEGFGLTPAIWKDFIRDYNNAYLDALGPENAWKAFTVAKPHFIGGYQGKFSEAEYAAAVRCGTLKSCDGQAAPADRGLGLRIAGDYEKYAQGPVWDEELSIPANGILQVHDGADTAFTPYKHESHLDNQIENWYGANNHSGLSDRTEAGKAEMANGIKTSLMRVLAELHSFIWLDGDDAALLNAYSSNLVQYAKKELGKRVSTAPDAWVYLGKWGSITAMPRWLVPKTVADPNRGIPFSMSGSKFGPASVNIGWAIPSSLGFDVDDRFLAPHGDYSVEVVITYYENGSKWHLDYNSTSGITASPALTSGNSNAWKSVAMRLTGFDPSGVDNGADLRVVAEQGAPVIRSVRVIKQ